MTISKSLSAHSNQRKPLVVGTIHNSKALAAAQSLVPDAVDFLEWRADHFPNRKRLPALPQIPLIITVRRRDEGGSVEWTDQTRSDIGLRLLDHASAVDVEWRSWKSLAPLREAAGENEVPVIASWHDFKSTPGLDGMRRTRDAAFAGGADLVKIACTLRDTRDLDRLAGFMLEPSPIPIALMGMGELGRISRLILAGLGSVLNYGYLGSSQIPGQWPAPLFLERLREAGLRSMP